MSCRLASCCKDRDSVCGNPVNSCSRTRSIVAPHLRKDRAIPPAAPRFATGPRLRAARLERGLRQGAVATDAGISASYLNLIEHGRRRVPGPLLARLAGALGAEASDFAGDDAAAARLRDAAAGRLPDAALAQAGDLARRHPDWAALVGDLAREAEARGRALEAMSDRLAHDPALSDAMHELLTTVAAVRSTASILSDPDLDPAWLRRFHAAIDEDSRRLATGAEAVVAYLDRAEERGPGRAGAVLPAEAVADLFDRAGHAFPALEAEGEAAIPALVAGLEGAARRLAEAALRDRAADARRLPLALVAAAEAPADLLGPAEGDLPLVLRRMAAAAPAAALAVIDASGALIARKPAPGFPLPVLGAGCPLWPLYEALARPLQPIATVIETPDGGRWRADAVAVAEAPAGADLPPLWRATMLVRPAPGGGAARPVGPSCRVCPRVACPARREPSVVAALDTAGPHPQGGSATA